MATAEIPGSAGTRGHKESELTRRAFMGGAVALAAAGGGFGVFKLTGKSEGNPQPKVDEEAGKDVSAAEVGYVTSFNGNVQNPELYDGRLNPNDLVDEAGIKPEAELVDMVTVYIDDIDHSQGEDATNMNIATAVVRNWELATNAPCSPAAAEIAMKNGYVLNSEDGPGKSIDENYEEFGAENFGVMLDVLTKKTYDGKDLSSTVADLRGYADVTASNFGNAISAAPDVYGASANTSTRITIDSVNNASLDLAADKKLVVGVTMAFGNGVYRDKIVKGEVYLLINEDGKKYDTTIAYLDLDKQE